MFLKVTACMYVYLCMGVYAYLHIVGIFIKAFNNDLDLSLQVLGVMPLNFPSVQRWAPQNRPRNHAQLPDLLISPNSLIEHSVEHLDRWLLEHVGHSRPCISLADGGAYTPHSSAL